jgi:hypothetical protein
MGVASLAHAAPATIVAPEGELRTLPQAQGALIGVVTRGQRVWVSDQAVNGWRRATLDDHRSGYVLDEQVRVDVVAPPARLRPPSPRLARPWVARLDLNMACRGCWAILPVGESDVSDASSVALTLGHNLTDAWALEGTIGFARGRSTITSLAVGATPAMTMSVDESPGTTLMANLRWAPLRSWWGRHALTVAGGPFMITGGAYGTVPFVHGELAYEYRPPFPFTFLIGFGPDVALGDSPTLQGPACVSGFLFESCRRPFQRGDLVWHFRMGLGATF